MINIQAVATICVLDPQNSDPAWGIIQEAEITNVWAEDLEHVQAGEMSIHDAIARFNISKTAVDLEG